MKVIEQRKRNMQKFKDIEIGSIFRYKDKICLKTDKFFSVENIEEYFRCVDIMEDIDDLCLEGSPLNVIVLSDDNIDSYFASIEDYSEVEVLNAELHIV